MSGKFVDIYTMTSDTNFGPHHDGELLTLASCMVDIRKRVGNLWNDLSNPERDLEYWIVGRVASSLSSKKKNHLIYFMMVDDVMNFAEYSKKFRFSNDENGRKDNIYKFKEESDDCFEPNNFDKIIEDYPKHTADHDIGKGKYVLLSKNYCYFDWQNEPYEKKLDEWDIPELEWIPSENKGSFRRKYKFKDEKTQEIIEKLKSIKEENCKRYIPGRNGCGKCGSKNTESDEKDGCG